jgi:hypothetical protein
VNPLGEHRLQGSRIATIIASYDKTGANRIRRNTAPESCVLGQSCAVDRLDELTELLIAAA